MFSLPVNYDLPVYRPPSEAKSLILQITVGCSWNRCAFCEMYSSKRFSIRKEEDIFEDIRQTANTCPDTKKIFLADGDALVLPAEKLLKILGEINRAFPDINRVSSYALPSNIIKKSPRQLKALNDAGLKLIYLGIESGSDELLKKAGKNETQASTIEGLLKAKDAGFKSSVMILNGLGGLKYSNIHAVNSAEILNAVQPEFASTLVVSFPSGEDRFRKSFGNDYMPLNQKQLFEEQKTLITHLELKSTVFRSDHASNYLSLKGNLNRDKEKLLSQIQNAIDHPDTAGLREEWQRGL